MHQAIEDVCAELEKVGEKIESWNQSGDRLNKLHGWNLPALSPKQLADLPRNIASSIKNSPELNPTDEQIETLNEVKSSLIGIQQDIIQHLPQNIQVASQIYLQTINYCSTIIGNMYGWKQVSKDCMPSALARKLKRIERDINKISPSKTQIEEKIKTILSAYDAAEELPTTLHELNSTQTEIRSASNTASELLGQIKNHKNQIDQLLDHLKSSAKEGEKIKSQIEEAYQIAATKGLAASFDARAKILNRSVYIWVTGLTASLILAMAVGYFRLEAMKEALSLEPFNSSRVFVQATLSILSIAAPVWFAWIATKQIGQRFRLAEDYAFKASVAKAYEGYRREAVRIDPEFEKVLFASALTRLDEAPLRLVELSTHGSPVHEFANSNLAKSILERTSQITGRARARQQDNSSNGVRAPEARKKSSKAEEADTDAAG